MKTTIITGAGKGIGKSIALTFAKENFSKIDILINNAGIGVFKHLIDTTIDEWKEVLDTNLTGTFLCSREAMKIMINQKNSVIINIASVVGIKGYPNQGAYTASKHGMVGLTKVIADFCDFSSFFCFLISTHDFAKRPAYAWVVRGVEELNAQLTVSTIYRLNGGFKPLKRLF